jgi:hypothetical protein
MDIGGGLLWWEGGMEELEGMSHCYMILWMADAPSVGDECGDNSGTFSRGMGYW